MIQISPDFFELHHNNEIIVSLEKPTGALTHANY